MSLSPDEIKKALSNLEISCNDEELQCLIDKLAVCMQDVVDPQPFNKIPPKALAKQASKNEDYYQQWKTLYLNKFPAEVDSFIDNFNQAIRTKDETQKRIMVNARLDIKMRDIFKQTIEEYLPGNKESSGGLHHLKKDVFERAGLIFRARLGVPDSQLVDKSKQQLIDEYQQKEIKKIRQFHDVLKSINKISGYIGGGTILEKKRFRVIMRHLVENHSSSNHRLLAELNIENKSKILKILESFNEKLSKKEKAAAIIGLVSLGVQVLSLCVAVLATDSISIISPAMSSADVAAGEVDDTRILASELLLGITKCLQGNIAEGAATLGQKLSSFAKGAIRATQTMALSFDLLNSTTINTLNLAGAGLGFASAIFSFAVAGINWYQRNQASANADFLLKEIQNIEDQIQASTKHKDRELAINNELERIDEAFQKLMLRKISRGASDSEEATIIQAEFEQLKQQTKQLEKEKSEILSDQKILSEPKIKELRSLQADLNRCQLFERASAQDLANKRNLAIAGGVIALGLTTFSLVGASILTGGLLPVVLLACSLVIGLAMSFVGRNMLGINSHTSQLKHSNSIEKLNRIFYSDDSHTLLENIKKYLKIDPQLEVDINGKMYTLKDYLHEQIINNIDKADKIIEILESAADLKGDPAELQNQLITALSEKKNYFSIFQNAGLLTIPITVKAVNNFFKISQVPKENPKRLVEIGKFENATLKNPLSDTTTGSLLFDAIKIESNNTDPHQVLGT